MTAGRRAVATQLHSNRGPPETGAATTGRPLVGLAAGNAIGLLIGALLDTPADLRGDYASWLPFFSAALGLVVGG